jgi:hypothetical protein
LTLLLIACGRKVSTAPSHAVDDGGASTLENHASPSVMADAPGLDAGSERAGAISTADAESEAAVAPPDSAPASSTNSPQKIPRSPVGAEALSALDRLPLLTLDAMSRHASSYDRTFNNVDYGNALGTDSVGDWVLMDARGPGCVYRIWFTGFSALTAIHVYFDDEATARIDMPLATFFGGGSAPFTAPLVFDDTASSGGFVSYLPLSYAKSIRITATPDLYYYNIDYHDLPADSVVPTWQGNEDLSAARALWAAAGTALRPGVESVSEELSFDLAPNGTHALFDGDGPAELTSIEVTVPGVMPLSPDGGLESDGGAGVSLASSARVLDQLWLSMSWDGETMPAVLAPLGPLFGLGSLGTGEGRGLLAGMRQDGTLYLYFPMPFSASAHVEIRNLGATAITGLWAGVAHQPVRFVFDQVGTFAVQYNDSAQPLSGQDLTLLETSGSGKIVGVVLSEGQPACPSCMPGDYLEGNEHILVDGARTPVVLGTGTEDFFNGGFYFDRGPFSRPSHGNVARWSQGGQGSQASTFAADATASYRFFLGDSISFRKSVRLSIQHGPIDDDPVVASSLVYYYRQARSRLRASDKLTIGDAADEAAHQYAIRGATWSGSFSSTFEGEFDSQWVSATGRSHKGESSFVARVDPNNQGVILRRLANQTTANQRARILVDGVLVRDWLDAGGNPFHAWREEDMAIPASVSAGKSSIAVDIQFVSSDSDWNEFGYEVYSQLP